jgi:hypothetical protein
VSEEVYNEIFGVYPYFHAGTYLDGAITVAFITSNPEIREAGQTRDAAVGRLILEHSDKFLIMTD